MGAGGGGGGGGAPKGGRRGGGTYAPTGLIRPRKVSAPSYLCFSDLRYSAQGDDKNTE